MSAKAAIVVLTSLLAASAMAEVPVEDAVQVDAPSSVTVTKPVLSQEQRLGLLEQQVNNLVQMGAISQVKLLQQQVQDLRGQVEMQAHDIKTLQDQLKVQYQDIDQRLSTGSKPAAKPVATAAPVAAKPSAGAATLSETDSYQGAYDAIKAKDYVKAEPALQKYLNQYPQGAFAGNAHYWLGEIYLSQGKAEQASQQFTNVIQQFPNYAKVAEAKVKLGFAYYDMGQTQQAKQQLQKVQQDYPGTPSARLAATRLQAMQ